MTKEDERVDARDATEGMKSDGVIYKSAIACSDNGKQEKETMKKIIIIISLLMLSNVVWAQKAPDGFFGLKWGSTLEEAKRVFSGLELLSSDFRKGMFILPAEGRWRKVGEAEVQDYELQFSESEGKFYWGAVAFSPTGERPNFDIFMKALTEKYGKPIRLPLVLKINPNAEVGTEYRWALENRVVISLRTPDTERSYASLSYTYLPIWNEMNTAKDKDVAQTKDKL